MTLTRMFHGALVLALAVAVLGCPSNQGTFTPAPTLKISSVTVSNMHAEINEVITIEIALENENLCDEMQLNIFGLALTGLQQSLNSFNPDTRVFQFTFTSPVTVEIVAVDNNAANDVIAFDVLRNQPSFFRTNFSAQTSQNYPRMGYLPNGSNPVNFQQFTAFFDPSNNENGVIDALTPFMPTGNAFRALSLSVQESQNFNMVQGSGYPLRSQSDPTLGVANLIVFGGGIAYSGTEVDIKASRGVEKGRRVTSVSYEPIFMAIVLRMNFAISTGDLVDVQAGNLSQGLVTPLFAGFTPSRFIDTFNINVNTNGTTPGTINGTIKTMLLGFGVTTNQGNIFDAYLQADSTEFDMPLLLDNNLGNTLVLPVTKSSPVVVTAR